MENATKALLIAAAVLITILLISLGMTIYNKSSSTDDVRSTLNSMEILQYNKRYEQYQGVRSGSIVKIVLDYAMDDNKYLDEERDSNAGINLRSNIEEMIKAFPSWGNALTTRSYGVMYSSNISKFRDKIKTTRKYKIWYTYDKNGLIHEIHIDEPYT